MVELIVLIKLIELVANLHNGYRQMMFCIHLYGYPDISVVLYMGNEDPISYQCRSFGYAASMHPLSRMSENDVDLYCHLLGMYMVLLPCITVVLLVVQRDPLKVLRTKQSSRSAVNVNIM